MPLLFFDLRAQSGLDPDDIGLELHSAKIVYIEACQAIPDMTAELLRVGGTPQDHAFEVTDEGGRML